MGKKIKKNNITGIIILLLYFVIRFCICKITGISGSAYIFSALDFMLIFIFFVPYALQNIVTNLVSAKVKSGQGSNAKRVLYGAFSVAIFYAVIVSIILLLAKSGISSKLLLGNPSKEVLANLIPLIAVLGVLNVIKGYFAGIKASHISRLINLFEKLITLICIIIFSNNYIAKGNKVSQVLYNKEYEYAYSAIGVSLGITVGLLITVIFAFIIYNMNQSSLKYNDSSQRTDDIYDVFSWISSSIHKSSGFITIFFISQLVLQAIYFGTFNTKVEKSVLSYRWGSYCGVVISVIGIFFLYFYMDSFNQKKSLKVATKNTNVSELRIKINDMIGNLFAFALPAALFTLVAASPIVRGLFGFDNNLIVNLLRASSLLIIFGGFAITTSNILNGIQKYTRLIVNSTAALLLTILSAILFISMFGMGLYGVIISFYVYAIVLSVMNYFAIKKSLKFKPEVINAFVPVGIISSITAVVSFLLVLLFGLFLTPVLNFTIVFIIFILSTFIAMVKFNIINTYTLSTSLIGPVFMKLGKLFKLF